MNRAPGAISALAPRPRGGGGGGHAAVVSRGGAEGGDQVQLLPAGGGAPLPLPLPGRASRLRCVAFNPQAEFCLAVGAVGRVWLLQRRPRRLWPRGAAGGGGGALRPGAREPPPAKRPRAAPQALQQPALGGGAAGAAGAAVGADEGLAEPLELRLPGACSEQEVVSVAFCPAGGMVAAATEGAVFVWNMAAAGDSGCCTRLAFAGGDGCRVSWAPTGGYLCAHNSAGDGPGRLKIWETCAWTGREWELKSVARASAWHPSGGTLLLGAADGCLYNISLGQDHAGRGRRPPLAASALRFVAKHALGRREAHRGGVVGLAWGAAGSWLAVASGPSGGGAALLRVYATGVGSDGAVSLSEQRGRELKDDVNAEAPCLAWARGQLTALAADGRDVRTLDLN